MLSTTMHRDLANASAAFTLGVFEKSGFHRRVDAALTATGTWQKRDRALGAPVVVSFVVLMTLFRPLGLPNVLKRLLELIREQVLDLSLRVVTPEAVCHARSRLGVEPLQHVFGSYAAEVRNEPSFRGLRVWARDGVRFKTPDTKLNERAFGRPGSSRGDTAFPLLQMVALVSATTRELRAVEFGRCSDSERLLAAKVQHGLGPQDLVLSDRGLSSVEEFEAAQQRGHHFLSRISASWKPEIVKTLGPGDYLVRVQAYEKRVAVPKRKKGAPRRRGEKRGKNEKRVPRRLIVLTLRMVQYQINNCEVVRLLTDLLDPETYPARELAMLYHSRWEAELSYDEQKTHLATVTHGTQHTTFRSKTPTGVMQEAYGMLVAYNLIRRLMADAGAAHHIPPLEISFLDTVETIRRALPRLQAASPTRGRQLAKQLLQDIADGRLDRPRRPRAYPRVVKQKMSNFKCKRRGRDRQQIIDFAVRLTLAPVQAGGLR